MDDDDDMTASTVDAMDLNHLSLSAATSSENEKHEYMQGFSDTNPCVVYVISNCKQQPYVPSLSPSTASSSSTKEKSAAATAASKKRKTSPLQDAQNLDAVLIDDAIEEEEDDDGNANSQKEKAPRVTALSCAHFRIASYAIWFGHDDARNECTTLDASLHMTPAHAQLLALERALVLTMHMPHVTIITPGNSTLLNTDKVLKVLSSHAAQGWRQPLTKHANVWRSIWLSNVWWRQSYARLPPVNLQMVKNDASNADRRAIFTSMSAWLRAHNKRITDTLSRTWSDFQLPAAAATVVCV